MNALDRFLMRCDAPFIVVIGSIAMPFVAIGGWWLLKKLFKLFRTEERLKTNNNSNKETS